MCRCETNKLVVKYFVMKFMNLLFSGNITDNKLKMLNEI